MLFDIERLLQDVDGLFVLTRAEIHSAYVVISSDVPRVEFGDVRERFKGLRVVVEPHTGAAKRVVVKRIVWVELNGTPIRCQRILLVARRPKRVSKTAISIIRIWR